MERMHRVEVGSLYQTRRQADRRAPGTLLSLEVLGAEGRQVTVGGLRLLVEVGGRGGLSGIGFVL